MFSPIFSSPKNLDIQDINSQIYLERKYFYYLTLSFTETTCAMIYSHHPDQYG